MRNIVIAASTVTALCACAGGGGGGGSGPAPFAPVAVPFTSFAAVQANQRVTFPNGSGQSVNANGTLSGANITSVIVSPIDTASTNGSMTYDGNKALNAFSVVTPGGSISFSRPADSIACTIGVCSATNAMAEALIIDGANPTGGFNYQTFGSWDRAGTTTSFDVGVFSFGAPTPGAAIPTVGNASFTGVATGFFVNSSQAGFATTAPVSANADFLNRTMSFATSGTTLVAFSNSAQTVDNAGNLSITGSFTWAPGVNALTSSNLSAPIGLNGGGKARFYGPNAQEVGGVYSLSGAAGQMVGSFGAKQP